MLSVKGIYENGRVRLLEPVPHAKATVIVTILEDVSDSEAPEETTGAGAFNDLIGAIEVRENGAADHDRYLLR